jgi:phage gp36-like protein
MSYAEPTDILARYDYRTIADLVNDYNVRPTEEQLLTDPNLQACLDDASGMIDSAIFVSNKYSSADLEALTDQDQAFLLRLNCDLAWGLLNRRRGYDIEKIKQYQEALEWLDRIRKGDRVFAVAGNESAGNPSSAFPSYATYQALKLVRDVSKLYPLRRPQQTFPGTNE